MALRACMRTDPVASPVCRCNSSSRQQHRPPAVVQRRQALLAGLVGTAGFLAGGGSSSQARQEPINKEVDAASSPYIQDLLAKTAANKERRYKERLDDYYKRNFKDYFEFEAGSIRTGKARGISEESQAAILKWLERNSDQPFKKPVNSQEQ